MVDLKFNFIGVETADFTRAFRFYTRAMGVEPAAASPSESWAMLVSGMDETPVTDATGLRCELFEQEGEAPTNRRWGDQQNLRPSIQVRDLQAASEVLHERGVPVGNNVQETRWGQSIELIAPEDVRWSIAHAPEFPAGRGLETPHIGWAELKVVDLERQERFYTEIMGLSTAERSGSCIRLEQGVGEPQLFLEPGGEQEPGARTNESPFLGHPVWMSFETSDLTSTSAWFDSQDVPRLQEITTHDWAGKDIVIEDPEGNPMQVVEYLDH